MKLIEPVLPANEATRLRLVAELEEQRTLLQAHLMDAVQASLDWTRLQRWVAHHPVQTAVLTVTGLAVLANAQKRGRLKPLARSLTRTWAARGAAPLDGRRVLCEAPIDERAIPSASPPLRARG
ncbi:MAG: hypothetical protein NDJ90_01355 [Oligoflexia bacterium]|nr:hypothetical protein [Oligoflexia bacterium]